MTTKILELSKNHCLNSLDDYSKNVPTYLNEFSESDLKQAYKLKKERIFKAPYYVTMIDRFMSGWGLAKGKTNKLVIACDDYKQAQAVKRNAEQRKEMRYINISYKPNVRANHYPSYKHYEDLGEIWTK